MANIQIALSNQYLFNNASNNDVVFFTSNNSQNILIGNTSNNAAGLLINSNSIFVPGNVNFGGVLMQNGTPYIGSQWSNNLSNVFLMSSNVGIGKMNPAFPLDVAGDLNFEGVLRQGGVPYIGSQWSNNSNNVFLFGSNVGIGTSNPQATLDVLGTVNISSNLNLASGVIIQGLDVTINTGSLANITNTAIVGFSNEPLGINFNMSSNSASNYFRYTASNIESMRITGNGNVGIGKSNPAFPLDVAGDLNFSGTLRQGGVPYVGSQWSNNSSNVFLMSSNVGIGKINPVYPLDVVGDLNFTGSLRKNGLPYVGSQWSNNSSNVFLMSSNVGIGNMNPNATLDITGTLYVYGSTSLSNTLNVSGVTSLSNAVFMSSNLTVSGTITAPTFVGNASTATNLTGTPNISVGNLSVYCTGGGLSAPYISTGGVNGNALYFGVSNPNNSNNPWYTESLNFRVDGTNSGSLSKKYWNCYVPFNCSGTITCNSNVNVADNLSVTGQTTLLSNVGIGTSTLLGGSPLTIYGTSSNNYSTQLIANTLLSLNSSAGTGNCTAIDFYTFSGEAVPGARIAGWDDGVYSAHLLFYTKTQTNVGNLLERMRITSTGNVGIGTSNPQYKFSLYGTDANMAGPHTAYFTSSDNYPLYQCLAWSHNNITMNFDCYYNNGWYSSTANGQFQISKTANLFSINYANSAVGSSIRLNPAISVNISGNVGIGTVSPSYKLDVNGPIQCSNICMGTSTIGAPSLGLNGGLGDKIILWSGSSTGHPYSMGINGGVLWYSVPNTAQHIWYIDGISQLTLNNSSLIVGPPGTNNTTNTWTNTTITTPGQYASAAWGPTRYVQPMVIQPGNTGGDAFQSTLWGADVIIRGGQVNIGGNNGSASEYCVGGNIQLIPGQGYGTWGNLSGKGSVYVQGALSKTSGTFDIPHPLDSKKRLVHSFIEGPRCDLIYRNTVKLVNGKAIINIDSDCVHESDCRMEEGTFVALCGNPVKYLHNNDSFDRVRGSITKNILTIICENSNSTDSIDWMVIAERIDNDIKDWNRTNSNGYLTTEYVSTLATMADKEYIHDSNMHL